MKKNNVKKILLVVIIVVLSVAVFGSGYYLGTTQKTRDLQDALNESKTGYIGYDSLRKVMSLGGLPQSYGQTFLDADGNTCLAFNEKNDVIRVIVLKDADGNKLINAEYDPITMSTSYSPIGNNTVEENTYFWIPEYSGKITTKTYKDENGINKSIHYQEIIGYKYQKDI